MKVQEFAIASAVAGALAAVSLGFAGAANAGPGGLGSADDIVKSLEAKGYDVVLNGTQVGPLSRCSVTGVHNPAGPDDIDAMGATTDFTSVYVDIYCPKNN
jgi:hypothetical protein